MKNPETTTKRNYLNIIKQVYKYAFSIFLIAMAIRQVNESVLSFVFFALLAVLLLPPIASILLEKISILKLKKFRYPLYFILFLGGAVSSKTDPFPIENKQTEQSQTQAPESDPNSTTTKLEGISVGDVLKTEYFEIIANGAKMEKYVDTGNEYTDLKAENGIRYLIINATFKNIDQESRMLFDGSVWINYNGKDYEFDKSETVMAEGWGLMLDQINPLVSKTTNLVYKIPSEVKGKAYWQPGRSTEDERIYLGELQ